MLMLFLCFADLTPGQDCARGSQAMSITHDRKEESALPRAVSSIIPRQAGFACQGLLQGIFPGQAAAQRQPAQRCSTGCVQGGLPRLLTQQAAPCEPAAPGCPGPAQGLLSAVLCGPAAAPRGAGHRSARCVQGPFPGVLPQQAAARHAAGDVQGAARLRGAHGRHGGHRRRPQQRAGRG